MTCIKHTLVQSTVVWLGLKVQQIKDTNVQLKPFTDS